MCGEHCIRTAINYPSIKGNNLKLVDKSKLLGVKVCYVGKYCRPNKGVSGRKAIWLSDNFYLKKNCLKLLDQARRMSVELFLEHQTFEQF